MPGAFKAAKRPNTPLSINFTIELQVCGVVVPAAFLFRRVRWAAKLMPHSLLSLPLLLLLLVERMMFTIGL